VRSASEIDDTQRLQFTLDNVRVTSGGKVLSLPGKMQVNLDRSQLTTEALPVPGERIGFTGYVSQPAALQNFFGYDRLETLRHREIFSTGWPMDLEAITIVDSRSAGFSGKLSHTLGGFRRQVAGALARNMNAREARLMTAMLFNDMRAITEAEKIVFRDSGTFHLFAVSGMHVAILGLALGMFFRMMRCGVRGSYVCVAVVLFLYLWIIGFVPSATRAYLMLVAFTSGNLLRREIETISRLVFSAAVVIAYDPAAPWDAGFLLSVGGVAGIALLVPLMREWCFAHDPHDHGVHPVQRALSKTADVVFATVAASIMLFPLQVWLFGYWNAMSVPANLLQGALSTLTLSAGILTAAAAFIYVPAAQAFGAAASALMAGIYWISVAAADAWWAFFQFRQIPLWLMLLAFAVLLGGYYFLFRDTPEFRLKSRARFAVHGLCSVGLLLGYQLYDTLKPRQLEIWAINVGQGDSTLLRLPGGETMLVDGGRSDPNMGAIVIAPQLRALGVSMLDYVVATHDDEDHTGGLAEVIRRVGARQLLLPVGFEAKSQSSKAMLAAAHSHGAIVQEAGEGFTAASGGCSVTVLNPAGRDRLSDQDNENSLVLRLDYGKFSALLMGDAGLAVESRLVNTWAVAAGESGAAAAKTPVTFLKLGHHGSRTASGEEFIQALRPAFALASCGAKNRFGHPAKAVVERLERAGTRLLRTDQQGAIKVTTDGVNVEIETCDGR
jgi:competence protein ComEC